jgi:initiation factor 1A
MFDLLEYAQVVKMLGNGRLEALCFDGEKRLAHIRGKLRKKVWINQGDIILLSLRDYQDEKGDVILKYSADEARSLKAYGELPESAKINETDTYAFWARIMSTWRAHADLHIGTATKVMATSDLSLTKIAIVRMRRRLMLMKSSWLLPSYLYQGPGLLHSSCILHSKKASDNVFIC